VRTFYYKAYDDTGGKRSGIIEAACREDVDAELRRNGLTPYFLHDYHKLKEMLRHKAQGAKTAQTDRFIRHRGNDHGDGVQRFNR